MGLDSEHKANSAPAAASRTVDASAAIAAIAPLFVPGDRPERFAKAAASGADAVVIDLEDAVAPSAKEAARANLRHVSSLGAPVIVRINARGTKWHDEDLRTVASIEAAALLLPKTESAADVRAVAAAAGARIPIIALIETAEGLAEARAIARVAQRLAFGSIDYCADIGCSHTDGALLSARSEVVLASRLAGRPSAIDGVTKEIADRERLRIETARARELGFGGKFCIHPSQVERVLAGFAFSEEERRWAARVLEASDAAGGGVGTLDGTMIDAPIRAMAERIIARPFRPS